MSTAEAVKLFRLEEPDLPASTVNWRLYDLVSNGVLRRVGRGIYELPDKPVFIPAPKTRIKKISTLLTNALPLVKHCVWDTEIVRSLAHHLPARDFVIVEAEKEALEQVYDHLKTTYHNVFYPKNYQLAFDYLNIKDIPIFVKPLLSESPLRTISGVPMPELEKILVDVYCDKDLFGFLEGGEAEKLWENARSQYAINITRLLRYADRRGRKEYFKRLFDSGVIRRKRLKKKRD